MRRTLLLLTILVLVVRIDPAYAHANLIRSNPPPNAVLDSAPRTIRLWFTEPVEPNFSSIALLDADGKTISTPESEVDADDPKAMTLAPGDLPDGLYTVSWRAISAADGHSTRGSFAFSIGAVGGLVVLAAPDTETIPPLSAPVRWFDLLALSVAVGSAAFKLTVSPKSIETSSERRMRRLMWAGWALVGVSSVVLLLYQAMEAMDRSWVAALPVLGTILTGTRFGSLWLARSAVWIVLGAALVRRHDGIALAAGGVLLLIHSVYSHASVTYDVIPAITSDWLHLAATALWAGGLIQFANVLIPFRHKFAEQGVLVARFSNYARTCVAALIVTGLYAAWLEVGSLDALIGTLYGRALIVKLILFVPLLGVAAINLFVTPRRLRAGNGSGLLRGLVGVEIALLLGIFGAVGVMTSADPARAALASRLPPPDHTSSQYVVTDDIHIHFDVAPGWVGQNTFYVTLYDLDGHPISDASLIRIRFDNQTQNVGRSELRPTLENADEGIYTVSGANLSVPGEWRARVTVQRPDKFDSLADFSLDMESPPIPAGLDMSQPIAFRQWALLMTGLALLAIGGFAGGQGQFRPLRGVGLLATITILAGIVMVISALI